MLRKHLLNYKKIHSQTNISSGGSKSFSGGGRESAIQHFADLLWKNDQLFYLSSIPRRNCQYFNEIIDLFYKKRQADVRMKRGRKFFNILRLRGQKNSILTYLFSGVDRNFSWRRLKTFLSSAAHHLPFISKIISEYRKYLLIWFNYFCLHFGMLFVFDEAKYIIQQITEGAT